jgi:hypothetical protein
MDRIAEDSKFPSREFPSYFGILDLFLVHYSSYNLLSLFIINFLLYPDSRSNQIETMAENRFRNPDHIIDI